MKSIQILLLSLTVQIISTANAWAECTTSQTSEPLILQNHVQACAQETRARGFSYLPRWIPNEQTLCEADHSGNAGPGYGICLAKIIQGANEIMSCQKSEVRRQQMAQYDEKLFQVFVKQYGLAEIPSDILLRFNRLAQLAKNLFPETQDFNLQFVAYNADYLNAHAGASHKVLASAGLWAKNSPLNLDQITAILAHEVGHVIRSHSLKIGCLALEWTGPQYDLAFAMATFREDLDTGLERGKIWSQKSVAVEYEADQLGAYLLKKMGLDPHIMAEALNQLRPKTEGFSSGSHPEFDVRIQGVRAYADQIDIHP